MAQPAINLLSSATEPTLRVLLPRTPLSEAAPAPCEKLVRRFQRLRARTNSLVSSLEPEDQMAQSGAGTDPVKWHLAHTTWFFEAHLLARHLPGYTPYDDVHAYLFDHADRAGGPRFPRERRGMLSRPTLSEVARYRDHVNAAVLRLLRSRSDAELAAITPLLSLCLQHELQHQETILTDLKHLFWSLPQQPCYQAPQPSPVTLAPAQKWFAHEGGLVETGAGEDDATAFSHERPRHRVWLEPFRLAGRLVTCGEYLEFMNDGGYDKPSLWAADGWAAMHKEGWRSPLYWQKRHGEWHVFTLSGLKPLDQSEPVCHVSFFEANAFSRWAGRRLPTEAEWELFAAGRPVEGNLMHSDRLHPAASPSAESGPWQLYGDCWEWTASPALSYPRFKPGAAVFSAFNAQLGPSRMVLRGGSCLSPAEYLTAVRRQIQPAEDRLACTGIRLAEDA
jgi:ergothioneine biosynthesis protein EgtB